jgi:predicted enzyme related to lactoylglutathione lyase
VNASSSPRVGGVLSADIAVPEHEREVHFYSRVLSTGENPLWREDLMNNLGTPIIGVGKRSAEYDHLPLQWMPHIQVSDVATSVGRALEQGGSELMHHQDDRGQSQWAVLLDPNGAAFGIIPPVSSEASRPAGGAAASDAAASVGRISWLDLTVPNASKTRDFYQQVVGWSANQVEMEDAGGRYADYALCADDGSAVAGVCHARGVNLGLPPIWLICLPVGDLAESLSQVREGGGEVIQSRQNSDGESAYAVVRDPVGACLALVPG